jgi:pimeloyl-ACP methyl ester carboxylesterase
VSTTLRTTPTTALHHVRVGDGPDVLLIAGLSDPYEAWQVQLDALSDRYRLTAFDNRSSGRSPELADGATVADMAADAVEVLDALGTERTHVMGFSGGSLIAQEVALRHPERVRSLVLVGTFARPDAHLLAKSRAWRWLMDAAPSERAALEAFFADIYTPRAHADGLVDALIDEALAFPHPQSPDAFQRQLDTFLTHDTHDRLPALDVPTLVVAGSLDRVTPPHLCAEVAALVPGAGYVVMDGEAHQPFQERPEDFHPIVERFWSSVAS